MQESSSPLQLQRIGRARFVVDPVKKKLYFHLWTGGMVQAGKSWRWEDEFDIVGIGINFQILKHAHSNHWELGVFLRGDFQNCYFINPETFLDFALKYRSYFSFKGLLLYVCSVSLFRIVPSDYSEVEILLGRKGSR